MSGSTPGPARPGEPAEGDPSMEDILASIRRILSEDEAAAQGHPDQGHPDQVHRDLPHQAAADEDGGILDLHEFLEEEAPHVTPPPEPLSALAAAPPPPVHEPDPPAVPVGMPVAVLEPRGGLVAPEAAAAAASSMGSLMRTLSAERSAAVRTGGPTLEDLVREEMRPMLKEWLDRHLPPVVERLVRAEIERVVGRATT